MAKDGIEWVNRSWHFKPHNCTRINGLEVTASYLLLRLAVAEVKKTNSAVNMKERMGRQTSEAARKENMEIPL